MGETTAEGLPAPPPPDVDPPCRRFTLFDAMVLIVATAAWFTFLRPVAALYRDLWRNGHLWGILILGCLWLGVLILTLTFLVLRLRDRRPPLRRLIRQPGMMACSLVTAEFVPLGLLFNGFWFMIVLAGSVALAWLAARWSGFSRREPGWIDGLGRSLGAGWIALAGFYLLLEVVW